jgi:anthranilate phosphoribosyltransferase
MRHAGPTRKEIGVRTAFNLLGPLTNPAGTRRQLLGVGDGQAAGRFAEVVHRLGTERTLVVHGAGVDELPLDGTGVMYEVTDDGVERRFVDAEALGLRPAATSKLAGGDAAANARYVEAVLRGEPGARRDVVLLNAGAAFMAAGSVETLEDGLERAALTIDAGLTAELLGRLRAERIAAEAVASAAAADPPIPGELGAGGPEPGTHEPTTRAGAEA